MSLFDRATEVGIATLVERFYARVRHDPELGPVFERVITDWPAHLRVLRDFWSSIVLRSRRYHGNPMGVHRALPPLSQALFERWLGLWRDTALEVFEPALAEVFIATSERVAQGLSLGLGLGHIPLRKPSRLTGPVHIVPAGS